MSRIIKSFFILLVTIYSLAACDHSSTQIISVMTFNIENGGTQVDFNKVVEAIRKAKAEVVGIQEAWGNTARLAQALGWKYYDLRQHIISRFPLYEPIDGRGNYLFIELSPGQMVAMANMHLPDEAYGTDELNAGKTPKQVEETERRVRLPTAKLFVDDLVVLAKKHVPVFLTGDFNSPSHLDWTRQTLHVLPQHHVVVEWAVSKYICDHGLRDSYRTLYSDPVNFPGFTWPAARPVLSDNVDHFNPTENDLPDRLDYIYTAGPSQVLESFIVGEHRAKSVGVAVAPWPSDHRAVVSRFAVNPVSMSMVKLTPVTARFTNPAKPSVMVEKQLVRSGEPFTITWQDAPGNRYDYIMLTPVHSGKTGWGEAVRLYTRAEVNGSVQYNAANAKGNWLEWYRGEEGRWPFQPGEYEVKLMLDDGYTELAATRIKIYPGRRDSAV